MKKKNSMNRKVRFLSLVSLYSVLAVARMVITHFYAK